MSWLLIPLALIYRCLLWIRDLRFRFLSPHKLPGFVISIGNIEAGGTGKSPVVMAVAAKFVQEGKKVAILSRGYKSSLGRAQFAIILNSEIISGEKQLKGADEAQMISASLPSVYLVLGPNRVRSANELLRIEPRIDVWIMDDGFQHRFIFRDRNIVITNRLGEKPYHAVFPVGLLREPKSSLSRADCLLYRRDPLSLPIQQWKLSFHPGPFLDVDGKAFPAERLGDIAVATAIAHPRAFSEALMQQSVNVVRLSFKRDHQSFSEEEIQRIGQDVDHIIVTEKDFWRHPNIWKSSKTVVVRATQHAEISGEFWRFINPTN